MTAAKEGANSLKVMLDAKLPTVAQLSGSVAVDANSASSAAQDIGQVQPVVQAYNQAIVPYISTQLTQQTKDGILTEMQSLLDRLGRLTRGLREVLQSGRVQEGDDALGCVTALAVFAIVQEQITARNMLRISDEDITLKMKQLLQSTSTRRRVGQARNQFYPGGGPGDDPGDDPGGGPGRSPSDLPPSGSNPPGTGPPPGPRPGPPSEQGREAFRRFAQNFRGRVIAKPADVAEFPAPITGPMSQPAMPRGPKF